MKKDRSIHVRLQDGTVIKISRQAKKEKVTFSEMVRQILSKFFVKDL